MKELTGRRAIVTGAASGIGRAIAETLARAGAKVMVVDLDGSRAQQVTDAIVADGGDAMAIAADVSSAEACRSCVELATSLWGGVDVLVNNAGIIRRATVEELSEDDWDLVMAVNVRSVFLLCKYVIPVMERSGGGSIVNISSGWGLKGGARAVAYCASKAAVANMTRALAIDHGAQGVRVNAVCPGDTNTGMLREEAQQLGMATDVMLAEAADRPLRRMGRPEEIAAAVLWLASDQASYVTGAALLVDGGGNA